MSSETGGGVTYEIRVGSELGEDWSDWFTGLRSLAGANGETVLIGSLDQAALHAVLRRIRDLGLPLVSVRRIDTTTTATDSEPTEDRA